MLPVIKRITPQIGLWLVVLFVCTLAQLFELGTQLRFDRALIAAGDLWLLFTANFVHLNIEHYLLNMAGLLIVILFFANQLKTWQWLVILVFVSFGVTLGMYGFNPEVHRYVGLSGVLHGLFIAGAVTEIRRYPLSGWILMIGLIAKLIWEQMQGAMPGSEALIKGTVMVDSHLYGAISGIVLVGLFFSAEKILKNHAA